jgi:site-specific DNA recombinase
LIRKLVERIIVSDEVTEVVIRKQCLMLQTSNKSKSEVADDSISIKINAKLKRCGYAMRLFVSGSNKKPTLRDENLIRNIAKAHQWLSVLTSGKADSVKQVAANENIDPSYVTRMLNRACLAPDIVRALLNGTQPAHLNLKFLKQFKSLPIDWCEQRQLLGFKSR